MANIASQIKRNRQNEKRRLRNKSVRAELRTRTKSAVVAAAAGAEDSAELLRLAVKRIDKAAARGVIHKNTAANHKSAPGPPCRRPRGGQRGRGGLRGRRRGRRERVAALQRHGSLGCRHWLIWPSLAHRPSLAHLEGEHLLGRDPGADRVLMAQPRLEGRPLLR